MKKRITALLLALAMGTTVLLSAGCEQGGTGDRGQIEQDEYAALFYMVNGLHEQTLAANEARERQDEGLSGLFRRWFGGEDSDYSADNGMDAMFSVESEWDSDDSDDLMFSRSTAPAEGIGGDSALYSSAESDYSPDFSDTNHQVEGVQESDIVKTDGTHIFVASTSWNNNKVSVVRVDNGNMEIVTQIEFGEDEEIHEMLLFDGKLIVIWSSAEFIPGSEQDMPSWMRGCCCARSWGHFMLDTFVDVYDTAGDFSAPISSYSQNGFFNSARMINNHIYLVTNFSPNLPNEPLRPEDTDVYIPAVYSNGYRRPVPGGAIVLPEELDRIEYTIIGGLDVEQEDMSVSVKANLGSTHVIYASLSNIYLARSVMRDPQGALIRDRNHANLGWWTGWWTDGNIEYTDIHKFSINAGNVGFVASATLRGSVRNQFHFDEHNGALRVVTEIWGNAPQESDGHGGSWQVLPIPETAGWWDEQADWGNVLDHDEDWGLQGGTLYTLDGNLNVLAEVHRLGFGENVHAVRFMGDLAYIVTFWQTDPLFAFDLSDPANPVLLGELKIPGFSRYLRLWDDGLLLGMGVDTDDEGFRTGLRMTMFDVSDNEDLIERHVHVIDGPSRWSWLHSPIEHDHRAALVSPGRNIIGFPYQDDGKAVYAVFSYHGDGFRLIGEIIVDTGWRWDAEFRRGLYIGNYLYAISNNIIVSARLGENEITEVQRLVLSEVTDSSHSRWWDDDDFMEDWEEWEGWPEETPAPDEGWDTDWGDVEGVTPTMPVVTG